MATLVALDLERVNTAASANEYFYRFRGIVLASVATAGAIGLLGASALSYWRASPAALQRAALRGITSGRARASMPLRTRMWLDGDDDGLMPRLDTYERRDRVIRQLSSETSRMFVPMGTLAFIGVVISLVPDVIAWVS
ncbi:hypothetical protein JOD63_000382 [Microbacterium terrae]|uniref:hypothetical protein n=1 Tax=Microbacterium terrae TaxID=69369 RepID=UPI0005ECAE9B|nr:hypothetical protein [Microbacterium terrae]MBP1076414.1 hypothetical protein [Microbacterium terrae]